MKVWVKYDKIDKPKSINITNANFGFEQLGAEIIPYDNIDDIYNWVTPDDIVVDFLNQVRYIFEKFNIQPDNINYPEKLKCFLGRNIWKDKINHINNNPELWGIFVKPIKEKAFTGRVINSTIDLIGCGSCYENYEVLCSDIIDIKSEYRMFITYDKIVDIKPYKLDYHFQYNCNTIDEIITKFETWENRPMGCSIDIGVTSDNKTVLIEVNDGYALGSYGLDSILYAKLISARWSQLFNRPDDFNFK